MPRLNIKPAQRRVNTVSTRYERRFVNGVWTVFDRMHFGHGIPLGSKKEADRIAADLNEVSMRCAAMRERLRSRGLSGC